MKVKLPVGGGKSFIQSIRSKRRFKKEANFQELFRFKKAAVCCLKTYNHSALALFETFFQ